MRKREAALGLDHGELALCPGERQPYLSCLVGCQRSLRQLDQDLVQLLRRERFELSLPSGWRWFARRQQSDRSGDVTPETLEQPVVVRRRDPSGERQLRADVLLLVSFDVLAVVAELKVAVVLATQRAGAPIVQEDLEKLAIHVARLQRPTRPRALRAGRCRRGPSPYRSPIGR